MPVTHMLDRSLTRLAVTLALVLAAVPCFAAEPAVELVGLDGQSHTITAAEWQKLPRVEVEAKSHEGAQVKYAGVKLSVLLAQAGFPEGQPLRGEWVRRSVVIEARDGYSAVYALAELDETLTDRVLLLADRGNGEPLGEHQGPFQIINPSEKRHSRWVRQVTRLRLMDSRVTEPKP